MPVQAWIKDREGGHSFSGEKEIEYYKVKSCLCAIFPNFAALMNVKTILDVGNSESL